MSYLDTLSMLEGQVHRLEDARMQESRERDRLRSEVNRLRNALKLIAAFNITPDTGARVAMIMRDMAKGVLN